MRVSTIVIAAGVSAPLIVSAAALGDFTGLTVESKPNEFGILVCNVYAVFDNAEDHLYFVYDTPENPSFVNVIGGTFYQHQFGGSGPPNPLFFRFAPGLRYDTYFTIGVKSFNLADPGIPEGQAENNLIFKPGFPAFEESSIDLTYGGFGGSGTGYFLVPNDAQGFPFNPDFVAGDGRVLIGQFSTADGVGIEGQLHVQFTNNGKTTYAVGTFEHTLSAPCPWDCGDGDGTVGIVDMLNLLLQWDQEGVTCSFNNGPVGILDFLEVLANWGACP